MVTRSFSIEAITSCRLFIFLIEGSLEFFVWYGIRRRGLDQLSISDAKRILTRSDIDEIEQRDNRSTKHANARPDSDKRDVGNRLAFFLGGRRRMKITGGRGAEDECM